MTITFTCGCGRQLAAADENAGQRVRCGACGGIQTVPGGAAAPRWVAEPAPMIRFACTDCGQTCQARPEFSGRNTRCPGCDRVLTIPEGTGTVAEAAEASPRPSPFLRAEKPLPPSLGRSRFEEDDGPEQDEDDRPRRRRSIKKKSRTWLWLSLTGTALVLAGGGLALWLLLRSTSSDFDLVPRDAQAFMTFRVADTVKSPLGKKVMDKFQQELALPLRELQDKTGLALADVERVTVVLADLQRGDLWVIVQTSRTLDRDKILKTAGSPEERRHQGKQYYVRRNVALAFLSGRLLIFGPETGVQRCLGLPRKPKSGPLDDALRAASKSKVQFAMGGSLPADLAGKAKTSLEQLEGAKVWVDKFAPLFDIRTAYLTYAFGEDVEWELVLTFPDSDKAKKGEAALNEGLSLLRQRLPAWSRQVLEQQGMAPKEVDQAIAQSQKSLEQLKPRQSGKTVSMAGKESGSQMVKQLDNVKKQLNLLQQGGGFGPPGGPGFAPPPAGRRPRPQPFPGPRGRGR
jgi:hypothetical protein